jgi:hypothetical protein
LLLLIRTGRSERAIPDLAGKQGGKSRIDYPEAVGDHFILRKLAVIGLCGFKQPDQSHMG